MCNDCADCRVRRLSAWLSYLNIAVLLGTLSIALLNASKDDVARNFGLTYAAIAAGVLVSNKGCHG